MPLNTTTGFPRASKLVEKKWEERRMRLHAQRVHEVQPLVNTAPPKVYPHMVLRLKKIQSEEVKQAEIDRDNQILLQRMTWILKRKGKIDNWNDYRQMSMNKMVREREQQEIAEKNLSIAKKLDSVKPYYNAQEWEEEYERKALLQNQWKHSTKEFDQSTPRSSMASRRANSYEDKKDSRRGSQKAKSDTSGSTVTKLPKIHNNGNTKYPREYTKPRKRKRRLSSRLSESEDEAGSESSSNSQDTEVKSSSDSSTIKSQPRSKEKARKKRADSDSESTKSQQKATSKKKEQKRKQKDERKPKKKEENVIRINEEEAESEEDDDKDDDEDEKNYEEVFDRQRIQSVKKDKRLRSCREDAPRAFSGMMMTEDDHDKKKKDKPQSPEREKTFVLSETGETGDESDLGSSNGEDLESRSESTQSQDPDPLDEDAIADQDAKLLFRAVKNLTKPEEVVIKTLIRRSPKQRMLTKEKFEQSYEMNLGPELKKVLGSPYFTLIDCLLGLKNKRDTSDIHSALKARDIAKLVEIFTSRGPSALSASAATYKKDYDVSLEQDLKERIPEEDCQNLLLALLSDRPVTEAVNEDLAARDAEELREAGEGRFNNENGKFILLIKQRSLAQLRATLNAYGQLSGGNDISELLEEDGCSKNFVTGVEALDESSKLGSGQWAEQIHGQLKPNNAELISTMLDRNDQEMTSIRKAYRKKFSAELTDDIMVKCGKEVGPLIAHIAARGGVTPAPGATRQPRPPPGEKPKRVNGMTVPSPPKKPPLKVFTPRTPEFGKDNPFQEPQRRPIGDHIRQDAKEKLDKKPPAKGNKTDRDAKKKSPAKVGGKGSKGYAADDDVKRVREAMKGWGTDEEPLIQILAGRTNEQRQQIRKKYQEKYKSDLLEDLKAELSGDLEEAVVALMMGPDEYDAYCLHDAISGPGTCEAVLIGILTTRSAKEMKAISGKYEELYEETLAEAVEGDTSDGFGELLGRLVRGERDQSNSVDQKLVTQDAEDLYQDGDEHLSSQNETFKDVMTKRNISHSQAVFEKYKKLSGHSIEEAIEDSFAGDLQDGYIGLAQAIQSTADFYAQRLHNAMSGMGTNDKTLIRILVSRSEVDLADIKSRYKALYKKSLDDAVDSECSGDYKKLLLALIKDKAVDKPKERRQRSTERRDSSRERRPSPAASKTSSRSTQSKTKSEASPRLVRRAEASKQSTPRNEKPPTGKKPAKATGPQSKTESQPISTKDGAKTKERVSKKKQEQDDAVTEKDVNDGGIPAATENEEEEERRNEEEDGDGVQEEKMDGVGDQQEEKESKEQNEKQNDNQNLVPRPPTPTQGTLKGVNETNAEDDVKKLEEALAGWNNDEEALIALLSERNSKQRLELRAKYEEIHSKELLPVIRSELKGDFELVVTQMLTSTQEQLASILHESLESIDEDSCILNALLALGTKEEIVAVNEKYSEVYKSTFVEDVKDKGAKPAYVNIIEDIMCGSRDPSYSVDEEGAKQDAEKMYNGGDHSLKLRDDTFKALLTTANRSQVKEICDEFTNLSGEDIVEGIKWAMIGDCEDAILGLVKCLRDPATYFAEHLQESMEGLGTNDSKLTSIIILRSEIDLQNIKERYKDLYEKDLDAAIKSECGGDYKRMLLALLSGEYDKPSSRIKDCVNVNAALALPTTTTKVKTSDVKGTKKEKLNEGVRNTVVSKSSSRKGPKPKWNDTTKPKKKMEESTEGSDNTKEKGGSLKTGHKNQMKTQKTVSKGTKNAVQQNNTKVITADNSPMIVKKLGKAEKSGKVAKTVSSPHKKSEHVHIPSMDGTKGPTRETDKEELASERNEKENEKDHTAAGSKQKSVLQAHLLGTILGEGIQGHQLHSHSDVKNDKTVTDTDSKDRIIKDDLLDSILKEETPEDKNSSNVPNETSTVPLMKDDLLDAILTEEAPNEGISSAHDKTSNGSNGPLIKDDLFEAILQEEMPEEEDSSSPNKTENGSLNKGDLQKAILHEEIPKEKRSGACEKASNGPSIKDDLFEAILQQETPAEENNTAPGKTANGPLKKDDLLEAILHEEIPNEKRSSGGEKTLNGLLIKDDLFEAILQEETPDEGNNIFPNKSSNDSFNKDNLPDAILKGEAKDEEQISAHTRSSNGPSIKDDLFEAILQQEAPAEENNTAPGKTANSPLNKDDLSEAILHEEIPNEKKISECNKGPLIKDDLFEAILQEETPDEGNDTSPNKTSNGPSVKDDLLGAILKEDTPDNEKRNASDTTSTSPLVKDDLMEPILQEETTGADTTSVHDKSKNGPLVNDDLIEAILQVETTMEDTNSVHDESTNGPLVRDAPQQEGSTVLDKTLNGPSIKDHSLETILQDDTPGDEKKSFVKRENNGSNPKESRNEKNEPPEDGVTQQDQVLQSDKSQETEFNETAVRNELLQMVLTGESSEVTDAKNSKTVKTDIKIKEPSGITGEINKDQLLATVLGEYSPNDNGGKNDIVKENEEEGRRKNAPPDSIAGNSKVASEEMDTDSPTNKVSKERLKNEELNVQDDGTSRMVNLAECKADDSLIKDDLLGLILAEDVVNKTGSPEDKESKNGLSPKNGPEGMSSKAVPDPVHNSEIKDDLLEMILKEESPNEKTDTNATKTSVNEEKESVDITSKQPAKVSAIMDGNPNCNSKNLNIADDISPKPLDNKCETQTGIDQLGEIKENLDPVKQGSEAACDNSDLKDDLLGLILAGSGPDEYDGNNESGNLKNVLNDSGKQETLHTEHQTDGEESSNVEQKANLLKMPLEENPAHSNEQHSESDYAKGEQVNTNEASFDSNVGADLLGAILGGATAIEANEADSNPGNFNKHPVDVPGNTNTTTDNAAVEYDILGSILGGGIQENMRNEAHLLDGKDEGIEMDTENTEQSSPEKINNDGQNQDEKENKGRNLDESNDIKPKNQVIHHVEVHVDSASAKQTPEVDKTRPRDPMLSDRQEEMERKSRTERMDTVDDINPEILKKLNLELYSLTKPSISENEPMVDNAGENQYGKGHDQTEHRGTDLEPEDKAIAVGGQDYASTDEEVADDELYADDWDPELEAVASKGLHISPQDVMHVASPKPPVETDQYGASAQTSELDSSALKVEEVSVGGDSGIGTSTDDIKKSNGKPRSEKGRVVSETAVKGLVSTIIENSLNEYTSNQHIMEGVGES